MFMKSNIIIFTITNAIMWACLFLLTGCNVTFESDSAAEEKALADTLPTEERWVKVVCWYNGKEVIHDYEMGGRSREFVSDDGTDVAYDDENGNRVDLEFSSAIPCVKKEYTKIIPPKTTNVN